jgi:two-component system, OmpR family, sensor kinase
MTISDPLVTRLDVDAAPPRRRAAREPAPADRDPAPRPRRWRVFGSIRTRLLLWFLALAGLALAGSAVVTNVMLRAHLDDRVDLELNREAERFQLVAARQPTGEGREDVMRSVFRTYLSATPLGDEQVLLGIVEGTPVAISAGADHRIDQLDDAVREWSAVGTGTFGDVDTPAGPLRYLAVPTQVGDEEGTLVIGEFTGPARAAIDDVTQRIAMASLLAVLAAAVIGWGTAGRALRPVRDLARAARSISHDDVSARLELVGRDEAAEMAETFNEMLDRLDLALESQRRLLRDVGHELRTPLTIIRGHLESLPDDPAERAATIQLLTAEIDRLARLVSDLRLLARADRPDFLTLGPVDVGDVVRDVAALAPALASREWRVTHVEEAVVVADRERLFQALLNLVQNAAAVTAEGESIDISARRDGRMIVFAVRDTGPGIPADELERIFDRFERGQGGEGGGTGLGLSIARAIVTAHEGEIWAENMAGGGARFSIAIDEDGPASHRPAPAKRPRR